MKKWKIPLGLAIIVSLVAILFLVPYKQAITFTETRTDTPKVVYQLVSSDTEFQIRYVHSIFLTDVMETYRIQPDDSIQFMTMRYEDVGIGLPAYAEEGETLDVSQDGMYTLTYEDKVIDSFVLYIGDVDAQLAFRYQDKETDLKAYLKRGHSYEFKIKKLTLVDILKGVNLNGQTY